MAQTHFARSALLASIPLALLGAGSVSAATPAFGGPETIAPGITLDPILSARIRWEDVAASGPTADAVSVNVRLGAELAEATTHLSLLAEVSDTRELTSTFNAFSSATPSPQYRPQYATVPDPQTMALNRLQLAWRGKHASLTVGRQAIALDDERFVGASPWRLNGQTFDAVRGTAVVGPLALDLSYVDNQNTSLGSDSGARAHLHGDFFLGNARLTLGKTALTAFAYVLDFQPTIYKAQNNSSQTYGLRTTGTVKLDRKTQAAWVGSLARQSNYGLNTNRYSADYALASLALTHAGATLNLGYELLGSDRSSKSSVRSVQTPFATNHKWDGWVNMFSTIPVDGVQDHSVGITTPVPALDAILPGFAVQASMHWFDSAIKVRAYGSEPDAAVTWHTGPVNWMVKYGAYRAKGFGVDTTKFWLQSAVAF